MPEFTVERYPANAEQGNGKVAPGGSTPWTEPCHNCARTCRLSRRLRFPFDVIPAQAGIQGGKDSVRPTFHHGIPAQCR